MKHRIDPSELSAEEMEAMESFISSGKSPALVDKEGNCLELPEAVFKMLVHIVREMRQNRSIWMIPENETFTTQAAANYLGVSRQHLVNLLEAGEIAYHKVGSHRRVYFNDLRAYDEQRDKNRRKLLDELSGKVSEAGKYESSYQGDER